jgi:hypothetical protein
MLPLTVEKTSDKAPTTEMTAAEKATTLYNTLKWPLIAYSLLAGLYMTTVGKNAGTWVWFSWHPLCMLVGFVAMAGNAALIKKIGGYENTKAHGIMMTIATVLTSFAWYVIYTNKEMYGKPHLISLHGKLGVGVMLSYFGLGAVGALGLHPDFGMLKTNKTLRLAHKVGGRIVTALAWACCVLGKFITFGDLQPRLCNSASSSVLPAGFSTMQSGQLQRAVFALPLLIFGFYVLL